MRLQLRRFVAQRASVHGLFRAMAIAAVVAACFQPLRAADAPAPAEATAPSDTNVPASDAADARADATRVLESGELPADRRLGPLHDLDGYFPFKPPHSLEEWNTRAAALRRQIQVSQGLWPLPAATPANAVVHGLVDRPEYTVERVYFESYPGHYVTGSLYRPRGAEGRLPGVLCPYGHWADGRFCDSGKKAVRQEIVAGAERFEVGGRSPLQSHCVQLARMGCVVFQYDMVGHADSKQLSYKVTHGFKERRPDMEGDREWGFFSPAAELRLQNLMGLQAYNSLRALDWFTSLPYVDPQRIGVTGASGGGTQTFMLCALDSRPAAAFPAVMVSTAMQGGCPCENAPLLRIGAGNVDFVALSAPRPVGMTGADDWTVEIRQKGLPELKQLYHLYGDDKLVEARALNQFGHNFNYVSRGVMYAWFNRHLHLGFEEPIVEEDYEPLSRSEMTVWDDSHPRPPSGDDYERSLLRYLTETADKQLAALVPHDEESLAEYRRVVGGAVDVIVGGGELPAAEQLEYESRGKTEQDDYTEEKGLLRRKDRGTELPVIVLYPKGWDKSVVVWLSENGKAGLFNDGKPNDDVRALLKAGRAVAMVDLLYQGEFNPDGVAPPSARRVPKDRHVSAYTTGYNRTLVAEQVGDVLSVISFLKNHKKESQRVSLVALDGAGIVGAAAAALAGTSLDRAAVDTGGFRFARITELDDVNFLPGIVKYGDVPAFLALAAPTPLWIAGEAREKSPVVDAAYRAAHKSESLTIYSGEESGEAAAAVEWILK